VKLHDLRPAPGSHKKKHRVGRGIAAGQGKTAGRGTKGQKARAGGTIPAWFEGGQTPLHQRLPKLHGFRNPFRIEYEVVNIGAIAQLVEAGILESGEMPGATPKKARSEPAPITVNQEILRAAGLVRSLKKPMKILGDGELSTALFVVADAVTKSARTKIEGAGGSVSLLEVPKEKKEAVGVTRDDNEPTEAKPTKAGKATPKAGKATPKAGKATAKAAAATADETPEAPSASAGTSVETEDAAVEADDAPAAVASTDTAETEAEVPSEPPAAAADVPAKPAKPRAPRRPKAAAEPEA
jgi:large subunit ribosomal protein L15